MSVPQRVSPANACKIDGYRLMNDQGLFIGEYTSDKLASFKDVFFPKTYIREAAGDVDNLLNLLKIEPEGKTLLDIPCGIGRHSFHLAKRGMEVVGVDLCKDYLNELSQEAENNQVNYETIQEDMRSFRRVNAFDVAISLWDSLGIFSGLDDDKHVVRNLYDSLKEMGQLLIEVYPLEVRLYNAFNNGGKRSNLEFTNTHYRKALKEKNISILEEKISFIDNFRRIEIYVLKKDETTGKKHEICFQVRSRSLSDWVDLLEDIGYQNISIHCGFSHQAYTVDDMINGKPAKILAYKPRGQATT